jgi:hypothetical protein
MASLASFFGDQAMTPKQIYKVVDGVFGTITGINMDNTLLSHTECVDDLVEQPLIRKMLSGKGLPSMLPKSIAQVAAEPENSSALTSTLQASWLYSPNPVVNPPFAKTRLMEDAISTDVSSVGLTPLAKVNIQPSSGSQSN